MTTVLATPITIGSAISGNVPLTIGGAVATGLSKVIENLIGVYKSKNCWVNFINELRDGKVTNNVILFFSFVIISCLAE